MKNILITGGLGFLGSAIAEKLIPDNRVTIVDNRSSHVQNHMSCLCVHCSIEDFAFKPDYDEIYHCASKVGPAGILKYAGRVASSIINNADIVFDWAMKSNAKLVFISTSEVYGHNGCFAEGDLKTMPPVTVRGEYSVGKFASELMALNRHKSEGLKVIIIRPFNMIGPHQAGEGGFVVPRFIDQALNNKPLTVFGDGDQIRSFTHVDDVVNFILEVMQTQHEGEVFNIGNPGNKISIKNLAELILMLTGSHSNITFVDPRDIYGNLYAEAYDKIPNIEKARKMTGWKPNILLEEALIEIIENYTWDINYLTHPLV